MTTKPSLSTLLKRRKRRADKDCIDSFLFQFFFFFLCCCFAKSNNGDPFLSSLRYEKNKAQVKNNNDKVRKAVIVVFEKETLKNKSDYSLKRSEFVSLVC